MTDQEITSAFDRARAQGRILVVHKRDGRDVLFSALPDADCRNEPGSIVIEDDIDLTQFLCGQHGDLT